MPGPFVLNLPAAPAYVSTARLFVGSVARHFGVDETAIEDAKVAVSEACAAAMRDAPKEDSVSIRIDADSHFLRFEVETPLEVIPDRESTTEDMIRNLGTELVQALFPGAESRASDARSTLTFGVPIGT